MLRCVLASAFLPILIMMALPRAIAADEPPTVDGVARELISQCGSGKVLADHDCGVARSMKASIQSQIDAGRSKQEILDYFVAAYGEGVLASPRKSGFGLTAWVTPLVVVAAGALVGGAVVWLWARRRSTPPGLDILTAPSDDLRFFEDRVEQDLRLLE